MLHPIIISELLTLPDVAPPPLLLVKFYMSAVNFMSSGQVFRCILANFMSSGQLNVYWSSFICPLSTLCLLVKFYMYTGQLYV